ACLGRNGSQRKETQHDDTTATPTKEPIATTNGSKQNDAVRDLVAAGVFDAANWRHRRALDESEPLEGNSELEELRQDALTSAAARTPRLEAPKCCGASPGPSENRQ